jgi:hypothetical protein
LHGNRFRKRAAAKIWIHSGTFFIAFS